MATGVGGGDEVVISVRTTGTEEAAASIAPVKAALEGIAGSAATVAPAAADATAALTEVGTSVDAIATVDAAAVALTEQLASTTEVAVATGEALATLGGEGTVAMDEVAAASAAADAAFVRFEAAAAAGSPRIQRNFIQIALATANVKEAIREVYGTIEAAPAAVQNAWSGYNRSTDLARDKTRAFNFESAEARRSVATGFATEEQAMHGLEASLGSTASQFGIFAAALGVSLKVFHDLGEQIGVDYSQFEGFKEGLKDYATSINTQVVNALSGMIGVLSSLTSGSLPAMKTALEESSLAQQTLAYATVHSKEATAGFSLAVHSGIDALDAAKMSTEELTRALEIHALAVKFGADGIHQWDAITKRAHGDTELWMKLVEQLNLSLGKQKIALDAATITIKEHLAEQQHAIDKLKALINAQDDEIKKTADIVASIGTEEFARKHLHATIQSELDDVAKLDLAKDGTSASIKEVAGNIAKEAAAHNDLDPFLQKEIAHLEALKNSTQGLSAATVTHITALVENNKVVSDLTAKNADLAKQFRALEAPIDAVTGQVRARTEAEEAQLVTINHQISQNQTLIADAKARLEADAALLKATTDATAAHEKAAIVVDKLTRSARNNSDETSQLAKVNADGSKSIDNVSTSTEKATTKTTGWISVADGWKRSISNVGEAADTAGEKLGTFSDAITKATDPTEIFQGIVATLGVDSKATSADLDAMRSNVDSLTVSLKAASKEAVIFAAAQKLIRDKGIVGGDGTPAAGHDGKS